jgi:hypothetical protein
MFLKSPVSAAVVLLAGVLGIGCAKPDGAIGPPTGKTGNQWTEEDFAGSNSRLAKEGGPEFVAACQAAGSCQLEGAVLDKFQEILAKYPVADSEEYDHFAVVVRQRLIENGLLPQGDPERYQYSLTSLAIALGPP